MSFNNKVDKAAAASSTTSTSSTNTLGQGAPAQTKPNTGTTRTGTTSTNTASTGTSSNTNTPASSPTSTLPTVAPAPSRGPTGITVSTSISSITPVLPPGSTTSSSSQNTPLSSSNSQTASAPAASTTVEATADNDDMGYTTGALAGAIVGSIIGAAIITFLVTWLFFGKRNKKRDERQSSYRGKDHRSPSGHRSRGVAAGAVAEKSSSSTSDESGFGWQAYLPQSADDQTVQNRVKTLFDQVDLHVDNYYTKSNVRIDSGTQTALSRLDDSNLPDSIDNLMSNPNVALPVIKHCIANLLLARMSPGFQDGASLLPAYLAAEPSKLHSSSMPPGENVAAHQAYSQWRLLNAYLHPQPQDDRNYQINRDSAAREIDEQISDTFGPWQAAEGLKQHQKSLVDRAGDVGVLVMSQPSAYEFKWNAGQDPSRSVVVFPGFLKTTDERGRPLEQPQTLVKPAALR